MTDIGRPLAGARLRTAFGLCGSALGIVNAALSFTILIYYDQVVGLNAGLAGLALALALCVDAVTDPLVGWWSDRVNSRYGRRHPFLLASFLPMFAGYMLIWYPPVAASNQMGLFFYLFGCSALIRIGMTLFDVPSNALVAELTPDYDERTRLSSYKVSASWMAANITGMLLYSFWLNDRGGPAGSGLLRPEGYQDAGLVFALTMLGLSAAMMLLLRPTIPYLRQVSEQLHHESVDFGQAMRALYQTYANRSILAILGTAVCLAAAIGLTSALWVYFMQFYFGLDSDALVLIQLVYLGAAVVTMLLLPHICKGRDKRRLTLLIGGAFWIVDLLPYALRTFDMLPPNGDQALMSFLLVYAAFDGLLINMLMALIMSMLTDVVEDNLLRNGRREEGVVLAGQTFVSKCSTALGTAGGGILLNITGFPQLGALAEVPTGILWNLGTYYWAVMWVMGAASMLALSRYAIRRSDHVRNVTVLEEQRIA
jgi:glycoside/pentoside/hexuronide:cation symporter, GPH family